MNPDSLAEQFPQLQSMVSQTLSYGGGLSTGTSVLLLAMVFTAWKMPWAAASPRFRIACWALFLNLASGPILVFIKPAPSSSLPTSFPTLAFAVAVLYFLLSLTRPPQTTPLQP